MTSRNDAGSGALTICTACKCSSLPSVGCTRANPLLLHLMLHSTLDCTYRPLHATAACDMLYKDTPLLPAAEQHRASHAALASFSHTAQTRLLTCFRRCAEAAGGCPSSPLYYCCLIMLLQAQPPSHSTAGCTNTTCCCCCFSLGRPVTAHSVLYGRLMGLAVCFAAHSALLPSAPQRSICL